MRIPPPGKVVEVGGGSGGKADDYQVYTGYSSVFTASGKPIHLVAGSFETFGGSIATARRTVFGWYGVRTDHNDWW